MRYQKFSPDERLLPFVECYFVWEGHSPEKIEVQSPPSAFCAMVFNYNERYQATQHASMPKDVPLAFASGQFTSNYTLVMNGDIGMIGVVMRATTIHNFFNIRMSTLVNSRVDLSLLIGEEASLIWTAITTADSDLARVTILDNFLLPYVEIAKSRLSIIDEAVEYIDKKRGKITVDEVANEYKITRRYLEKKFMDKVGVSPKFYARVKRFTTLSAQIASHDKIDWQEIILEHGFHDQSHLAKEFMEFNKMNPSRYLRLNKEMARLLKK